jgi:hypothetical protein
MSDFLVDVVIPFLIVLFMCTMIMGVIWGNSTLSHMNDNLTDIANAFYR